MAHHSILVTAPGGNIGSELVPLLLESSNTSLILLTSNAARLRSKLPSLTTGTDNVAVGEGDITDPIWIQAITTKHSIDVVFLCLTGTDVLLTTLNFLDAIQRAGTVKQLIFISACGDFVSQQGTETLVRRCSAMHVLVNALIEQKLKCGGFKWKTTVLGPTLFVSNDLRSKKSMMEHGVFDEPLGEKGVSRVSTADIALAVRNVISEPDRWDGKKLMLGSKRLYTGAEVAALWSRALGKEVRMWESDARSLDRFEEHGANQPGMGFAWGRDLRLMYEWTSRHGFGMSNEEYLEQVELLGRDAEDYENWVMREGAKWQ